MKHSLRLPRRDLKNDKKYLVGRRTLQCFNRDHITDKTLIHLNNILQKYDNSFGEQYPILARTSCRTHDGCTKINLNTAGEENATGAKLTHMTFGIPSNEKMKIGSTTLMIPGEAKHRTDNNQRNSF